MIDLVSSEDGEMMDEDEEEAGDLETTEQQLKCSVSHAEAFRMFDQCLIWLRFQQEASLANTSTLMQLRELAAEKRESSRKLTIIDSFFY